MAAKVVLRQSESFTAKSGEHWRKNQSRTLHDDGEIAYYRSQPEFTVTEIKPTEPPKARAVVPPAATPAAPPPDPPAGDPPAGDPPAGDGDSTQPPQYTEASLSRMTKGEIVELAATQLEIILEESSLKDDLVSAYLEAQAAKAAAVEG